MTADLAGQYAHILDGIAEQLPLIEHACQVYDAERDEYETRPIFCPRCNIERLLDSEPAA